jgi:ribosome maturation factor RimP
MIDSKSLEDFIAARLAGTDYFPVEVSVTKDNEIRVEIDSIGSVDIDYCMSLSRAIEEAFPREEEDYELEVGSAGITSPFKVHQQYLKNVGQEVEVLTADGRKLRGILVEAGETSFTLRTVEKVKHEGSKRPVLEEHDVEIGYADAKSVKCELKF